MKFPNFETQKNDLLIELRDPFPASSIGTLSAAIQDRRCAPDSEPYSLPAREMIESREGAMAWRTGVKKIQIH